MSIDNKIHKIALNSALISKKFFAGNFTSLFCGNGINFKELRDYQIGDDVKSISWTASARYSKTLIKINEEDKQQHVIFLIDVSKSIEFGTKEKTKKDLIIEICFLIAYSSYRNNDKIAAIFFSDKIEKVIPLSNNKHNLSLIANNLINFSPTSNGTDYSCVLNYLTSNFSKDSIVFIFSDFITELNYETELGIAAKKFKIVPIKISDPIENKYESSNSGLIKVLNEENGIVHFVNLKKSNTIRDEIKKRNQYFFYILKKHHIKYITLETNSKYILKLISFFQKYKK